MSTKIYDHNTKVVLSCGFTKSHEDPGMFNQVVYVRENDQLVLDEYGILHYNRSGVAYKGFNMFADILSVGDFM